MLCDFEMLVINNKKWANTKKNAPLCQNVRTEAKENIFQQKYEEVDKKNYFSETEKHKREKCNPSEYFFPGGVFF